MKKKLYWAHTLETQDSRVNSQGTIVNMIPQISISQGHLSPYSLVQRPGICSKSRGFNRLFGLFVTNKELHAITEDKLLKVIDINANIFAFEEVGDHEILKSVRLAVGDGEVIYTDGLKLYSYIPSVTGMDSIVHVSVFADSRGVLAGEAGSDLTDVAMSALPPVIDVAWTDSRFAIAVNETIDGREQSFIYPSDVVTNTAKANGRVYRVSDRLQANSRPDGIVALASLTDQLYVFGEKTCEVLHNNQNAGAEGQIFIGFPQGSVDIGCAAKETVSVIDDKVFFIDPQGGAYFIKGVSDVTKVSTQAEDRIFATSDLSKTICWEVEWASHKMYHIKPFDNRDSLVYDYSTQLWHRHRTSNRDSFFRSIASIGTRTYAISATETLDEISCSFSGQYGEPTYCEAITQPFSNMEKSFCVPNIEFLVNMGDGTADVLVDVSWDDGTTWNNETKISLSRLSAGGELEYRPRAVAYGMGCGRRLSVRFRSQTLYPITLDHMVLTIA